jgi:Spy/CpxP family protein refolding chaperone
MQQQLAAGMLGLVCVRQLSTAAAATANDNPTTLAAAMSDKRKPARHQDTVLPLVTLQRQQQALETLLPQRQPHGAAIATNNQRTLPWDHHRTLKHVPETSEAWQQNMQQKKTC